MLVFEERGKLEYPEKNLSEQGENQQQTQPTYDAGSRNRTWDTLGGGERSHHCAIPAPQSDVCSLMSLSNLVWRTVGDKANGLTTPPNDWDKLLSSAIMISPVIVRPRFSVLPFPPSPLPLPLFFPSPKECLMLKLAGIQTHGTSLPTVWPRPISWAYQSPWNASFSPWLSSGLRVQRSGMSAAYLDRAFLVFYDQGDLRYSGNIKAVTTMLPLVSAIISEWRPSWPEVVQNLNKSFKIGSKVIKQCGMRCSFVFRGGICLPEKKADDSIDDGA